MSLSWADNGQDIPVIFKIRPSINGSWMCLAAFLKWSPSSTSAYWPRVSRKSKVSKLTGIGTLVVFCLFGNIRLHPPRFKIGHSKLHIGLVIPSCYVLTVKTTLFLNLSNLLNKKVHRLCLNGAVKTLPNCWKKLLSAVFIAFSKDRFKVTVFSNRTSKGDMFLLV